MRPSAVTLVLAMFPLAALLAALTSTAEARSARMDRLERAVVREVNQVRAGRAPALRRNRALARAAHHHSRDMLRRNFFAHASSDGTSFASRVARFMRARRVAETLAYVTPGPGLATRVVRMWMDSPPHRAILLDADFRRVGVAKARGRLGSTRAMVVTADFASSR